MGVIQKGVVQIGDLLYWGGSGKVPEISKFCASIKKVLEILGNYWKLSGKRGKVPIKYLKSTRTVYGKCQESTTKILGM